MLSYEWQELEGLCDRTAEMRGRWEAAQRSHNAGLIESLKKELDTARRQREQLIRHISARIGSIAA
jgi:hypothetical protein